eukprot:11728096-Ditylum_brightwellii.AAC.1
MEDIREVMSIVKTATMMLEKRGVKAKLVNTITILKDLFITHEWKERQRQKDWDNTTISNLILLK